MLHRCKPVYFVVALCSRLRLEGHLDHRGSHAASLTLPVDDQEIPVEGRTAEDLVRGKVLVGARRSAMLAKRRREIFDLQLHLHDGLVGHHARVHLRTDLRTDAPDEHLAGVVQGHPGDVLAAGFIDDDFALGVLDAIVRGVDDPIALNGTRHGDERVDVLPDAGVAQDARVLLLQRLFDAAKLEDLVLGGQHVDAQGARVLGELVVHHLKRLTIDLGHAVQAEDLVTIHQDGVEDALAVGGGRRRRVGRRDVAVLVELQARALEVRVGLLGVRRQLLQVALVGHGHEGDEAAVVACHVLRDEATVFGHFRVIRGVQRGDDRTVFRREGEEQAPLKGLARVVDDHLAGVGKVSHCRFSFLSPRSTRGLQRSLN